MDQIPWQVVRLVGAILLMGPPVAYYVYADRKHRDESRPLAWAVGIGFLGVAGLLLYLHLRGDFAPE